MKAHITSGDKIKSTILFMNNKDTLPLLLQEIKWKAHYIF